MAPFQHAAVHEAFAPLIGDWTGEEKLEISAWGPAGTAAATIAFRGAVAGLAVLQDYHQRRSDGREFFGHGVFMVDPAAGQTLWYLFDSYGHPPETPARGGWEGSTLTLVKSTARGSARHRFHLESDELTHEIDVRMDDASAFVPFLRGRYRRVSGA